MASTAHGVLTADQVSAVNITPGNGGVVVVNRDLTGEIWVRIDGGDPAIAGADSYVVTGAREFPMTRRQVQAGTVTVKMLSTAGRSYSVEAIE